MSCNTNTGPFSKLRGGSNNNIYIIPVPQILTFNAVMLLTAGFCIPAILSLFFTWDKILEINWKSRRDPEHLDHQIEGANITVGELKGINNVVRQFLSVIEVPLFGGIILTIIGIGEANFFSRQVIYETEPMASIGECDESSFITSTNSCYRAMGSHCRCYLSGYWLALLMADY